MIVVAGDARPVREAVSAACTESGAEARAQSDAVAPDLAPGDSLVDLGLPPGDWPGGEALVADEAQRVEELARRLPDGCRVVRRSLLGAAPDARSALQRAQAAAEDAWRRSSVTVVAMRAGVLLGEGGPAGGFRAAVERSWIVPVPGVSRAKLEPLLLDDFARYCVEALRSESPLDESYELGCGEILSGELLARGLAENLGVRRWIVPVPRWAGAAFLPLYCGPNLPLAAMKHWLSALRTGLLPRRTSAWTAFAVRPVELREAMAFAAGMQYAIRRPGGDRPFGAWQAPERKGVLWSRSRRQRR